MNGLKGEKLAPNWPQPLALAAKFTPKWPKMAAKGPHWYHVVTVWPIEPDLWSFKQLGEKLAPNWLQTGSSLLLWQLKVLEGTGFIEIVKNIYIEILIKCTLHITYKYEK